MFKLDSLFKDVIEALPTDAQFGNDEGEEEHQLTLKDNGIGKVLLGCPAFVWVGFFYNNLLVLVIFNRSQYTHTQTNN